MDKAIYGLCEGDIIQYIPTNQIGSIVRIHEDETGYRYELKLRGPDEKIWCDDSKKIRLLWANG